MVCPLSAGVKYVCVHGRPLHAATDGTTKKVAIVPFGTPSTAADREWYGESSLHMSWPCAEASTTAEGNGSVALMLSVEGTANFLIIPM